VIDFNKTVLVALIFLFLVVVSVNVASAVECWSYTTSAGCSADSLCDWKSDSWGSWCEQISCWNFNSQSECSTTSVQGQNCTWQSGGSWDYCEQVSCWTFSGGSNASCESNSAGLSCNWAASCYSTGAGGSNCWNINDSAVCQNTTGCGWGDCRDKGCWEYTSEGQDACNAAINPWGNNNNCTWSSSSSSCTENSCSNYNNQTACNNAVGVSCNWNNQGWCQETNCFSFNTESTCQNANTTNGIDCLWETSPGGGSFCVEDNCWSYDEDQNACNAKSDCVWTTSTSTGWCEEARCWSYDSWNGGNQTLCENNEYGLSCSWEGNPSGNATNGWCFQDISGISCSSITNDKNCYDTFYCWWQANDWSNFSAGGNCTDPDWAGAGGGGTGVINEWNPGCYTFDNNATHCNATLGCVHNGASCDEVVGGSDFIMNYSVNITNDGLRCGYINDSALCNELSVLSSCCSWQNGTCSENRASSSCWNSIDATPNGETSCEGAGSKNVCNQLAGTPWYWPCTWDNSSSTAKCTVKSDDLWGNRTKNLVAIENSQTCKAIGGKWVAENYCQGDVSVPSGRCEYKFDEETNCNKACFACEYKSDGTAHSSLSDASEKCLGSALGFCEFNGDSNAPNGYGYCNARDEFKTGVANDCDSSCGACTFLGDSNGVNGTKTPEDFCDSSNANSNGGGCKWTVDSSANRGGYCIGADEKTCADACDRCGTQNDCSNVGRTAITNGTTGSCKWQSGNVESCVANIAGDVEVCWNGEDDDDDSLIDCVDPSCYSDSFCGFVEGDCFNKGDNTTCLSAGCEWVNDTWNPAGWCDFKGASCWKFDGSQDSCLGAANSSETLDISAARLAGNNINESHTFTLANLGSGWVVGSVAITNTSGTALTGNFSVDYTNQVINFTNNTFMVSGGGAGNLTNVSYQYYQTTNQNCKWESGSGNGWCEQDWSLGEECFAISNATLCATTATSDGQNCAWTNDTWCNGDGATSDWCLTSGGGWCDHPNFASNDCWQHSDNSSCSTSSGCSWSVDEWSAPHCDVNWSGGSSIMDECWQQTTQSACGSTTASCTWNTQHNACEPSCFNQPLLDDQTTCSATSGCVWLEETGWCQDQQSAFCFNETNANSQPSCDATAGCKWRNPGWCNPKDGFSTGAFTGGGGIGGAVGADCYKYDGNQTLCTDKSIINISCGWFPESNPFCEVDWSGNCWENSDQGSCDSAGCWWNPSGNGYCTNVMDQCWSNTTLQNDPSACNANAYCNSTSYGCEPTCFSASDSSSCTAGCKWLTGWCNPAGMVELFDGIETGAPAVLATDVCDGSDATQASVDVCGIGMKDMGDAYGFGANVLDFTNSSVCNKIKVGSGFGGPPTPGSEVTGAGNETVKLVIYLDTDGSTSDGCSLVNDNTASGYEFRFRYSSVWNSATEKAEETYTAYKCKNSDWKASDIKLSAWKNFMCSDIGGPMIAVEKGELSRFPSLYSSTADIRVYAATIGNTGNISSPSDTAGPGYATPGAIDFEVIGAFEFGADSAKFEDILKKGFVQGEDCFTSTDDDNDGLINCNDWDCQFASQCEGLGVNVVGYEDTKMVQVTGAKIEEYTDSALVMYDTNKPSNGTLLFYKNDSTCSSLNDSILDIGITSSNVREYKLWHAADIYEGELGYTLDADTKYYYKLNVCDDVGKCSQSKCTTFYTAPANRCGFCDFVARIKAPDGWIVSYDLDQSGTYEHIQGEVCGTNAGMKTNYTAGRNVNIKIEKSDSSTYFEFINASLTKSGLNDKVRTISGSGDIISSSTLTGLTSETRDKIINNLHPEICRVKVPKASDGSCSTLQHCDDNGENCEDRTADAGGAPIDAVNCVWNAPNCEFSTYRIPAPSGSSSSSGGGSSGGGGGGGVPATVPATTTEGDGVLTSPPVEGGEKDGKDEGTTGIVGDGEIRSSSFTGTILWTLGGILVIGGAVVIVYFVNKKKKRLRGY